MCEGALKQVGSEMEGKELTRDVVGIAEMREGFLKEGVRWWV